MVDEETHEAYGHVIAVDPTGRIFVIPLVNNSQPNPRVVWNYACRSFLEGLDYASLPAFYTPQPI